MGGAGVSNQVPGCVQAAVSISLPSCVEVHWQNNIHLGCTECWPQQYLSSAKRIRAEQSNLHKHHINNSLGEDCILILNSSRRTRFFQSSENLLQLLLLTNISVPTAREGCVHSARPQIPGWDLRLPLWFRSSGNTQTHAVLGQGLGKPAILSTCKPLEQNISEATADTGCFSEEQATPHLPLLVSLTQQTHLNDYLHFPLPTFLSPPM